MNHPEKEAFLAYQKSANHELPAFLESMDYPRYEAAAQMILDCSSRGGRLHITGHR